LTKFKRIISFFTLCLLSGLIWWIILLFNTFPKKVFIEELEKNNEKIGIVVLTGGKSRIEKGLDLLLKGYGNKLFISGVFMPSEIQTKFSLEREKSKLIQCCVFFGEKATNTLENAYEVNKWLEENDQISSIILVSSYYHLPRSIMIFEKKIKPNIKIFPVPAVVERNIKDQPFFHIKLIVSEYLKVIYTIIFIR
tara:strand:- start:7738 stop:8322 length:585 start_codon:yes stop_codon:yes gene_type:complete